MCSSPLFVTVFRIINILVDILKIAIPIIVVVVIIIIVVIILCVRKNKGKAISKDVMKTSFEGKLINE